MLRQTLSAPTCRGNLRPQATLLRGRPVAPLGPAIFDLGIGKRLPPELPIPPTARGKLEADPLGGTARKGRFSPGPPGA